MDPRGAKPHSKRDAEQLTSRRPNRLFLSETIPPSIHQHHPQASQSRNHNLSDRIHEYYEKLVKNSQSNPASQSRQFTSSNLQHRFGDSLVVDHSSVAGTRYGEQVHPSVSVRPTLQPINSTGGRPYTIYVDDTAGAFQRYNKRKPSPALELCAPESGSLRGHRERSKSPNNNRGLCALCHSSNHTSQSCTLNSHAPAEHDGFFSEPLPSGGSPPTRHPKVNKENQGDGSEGRKTSSFSKRHTAPANINVSCERDVIGQEKSPVSKSHPVGSAALSTSSSNGDTVPRERKKWVRPPLVGQAASAEKSPFMGPAVFDCLDDHSSPVEKGKTSSDCLQLSSSTGSDQPDSRGAKVFSHVKSSYFDNNAVSCLPQSNDDFFGVDRDVSSMAASQHLTSEGEQGLSDSYAGGRVSPSSSVTSNRRLEWDSGADVGYNQIYGSATPNAPSSGLCTIERMALAQGCSVALRLDPEGTTVPASSSGIAGPVLPSPVLPSPVQPKPTPSHVGKPAAESTPLDHTPHIAKAFIKYRNDPKNVISPILHGSKKDSAGVHAVSSPVHECEEVEEKSPKAQTSRSSDSQASSCVPFSRQLSNSMQDIRNCGSKQPENQLLKSQSDPDLSGETPTLMSQAVQTKFSKSVPKVRNLTDVQVCGHSISSGSDATLVHVGTEEDLAVDANDDYDAVEELVESKSTEVSDSTGQNSCPQAVTSVSASVNVSEKELTQGEQGHKPEKLPKSTSLIEIGKKDVALFQSKPTKSGSNTSLHVCSDTDHKRGLHHHFGVLCSTVLGGHIQSPAQPNPGSQLENTVCGPDRVYGNAPSTSYGKQQSRDAAQSPPLQDSEVRAGESTGSSAFHSDVTHEDNIPCASTLSGRANSFEYLPGHMFEKNPKLVSKKHERPPGISTSTETDSEPVRPMSRLMHRKVMDSSSHDTEDDRLWASPRIGSNTLVEDLERGVNLLKGVMENKSAGRRSKRELIRRIIKKLVTSEYVEDIIEKERIRKQTHSPFSPKKIKYLERQDRNIRSKRNLVTERQEISGESDQPKRSHNVRRKITTHQATHHPPAPRTLSTLASGSKSSSLWSSHADSTSGSISLSGSSDIHKESKNSVKTNPLYEPHQENTADWLKPATQSEKLFEMRKTGTSQAERHLAGIMGMHAQEPVIDPIAFKNDPQKQLSWVTNEINHLRILKQLLQKQESLKQSLDPNLCRTNYTTMPVTGLKQTMHMADCTSPDIPEAHSPKSKPSRLQQWISLESDTSAGFGLSNNTGSSRDSHWQEVEVASAGEQDKHPHRTVSISDNDQNTDVSGSLSNRKSDVSHNSAPKMVQKPRRRSVSISDADQQLGPPSGSDAPIQKKRSDCHCGKPGTRVYNARPSHTATYGPPPRNISFDRHSNQVNESCTSHSHLTRKDATSAGAVRGSMANRGMSSLESSRTGTGEQQSHTQGTRSCSCGASRAPAKSCCCSFSADPSTQGTGVVKKGATGSSHQLVSRVVSELPANSLQPLSGGGMVRVHIDTNQDSPREKSESQRSSIVRDRVRIADVSDVDRGPVMRAASDDSITKAVSEAVSTKVKALRNLGQIEEAEVKIRVRVAPGQVSEEITSQSGRGRVLKTQDLDDENNFHPSKHSELDDTIARQMAMDLETRQKLLAIAESRQRAQMGLHDIDRRIQDLLLQDYLSRQFKAPETASTPYTPHTPHARLNVRVETPITQGSSIGVQSEVDKKTIGTSTIAQVEQSQQSPPPPTFRGACVCGTSTAPLASASPRRTQGQQTEALNSARPQTAPTSCLCSCQSQPASTPRTYHASPPFMSPGRQVEFELELRKQRPCKLTPYEVHETLKSRNKAYFLQFEEDVTLDMQPERDIPKPPIEVVTVKIPKQKQASGQPSSSSNRPLSSQGSKKTGGAKGPQKVPQKSPQMGPQIGRQMGPQMGSQMGPQKPSGTRVLPSGSKGSSEGTSQSPTDVEINMSSQGHVSVRSGVESPIDASNILKVTPGRSHLSITITDSSADSMPSPDGDSRYSSFQHPSRKPHKSPRTNKRKERMYVSSRGKGDVGQTMEIKAEGSNSPGSTHSALNLNQQGHSDSDSLFDHLGNKENPVPTLQEYLEKNHPKYLDAAERRRRCIAEMSYLRRLRQQSRKRLIELEGDNMWAKQKQQWRSRCASRPRPALKKRLPPKSTKSASARRYMFLPENQQRFLELKKKEEKRTNRLMAEIYTRKLQEKVLKGTATIRSSVSVISSL